MTGYSDKIQSELEPLLQRLGVPLRNLVRQLVDTTVDPRLLAATWMQHHPDDAEIVIEEIGVFLADLVIEAKRDRRREQMRKAEGASE